MLEEPFVVVCTFTYSSSTRTVVRETLPNGSSLPGLKFDRRTSTVELTYLYFYLKGSPSSRWSGLHHIITPFSGVLDPPDVPCLLPVILHLLS